MDVLYSCLKVIRDNLFIKGSPDKTQHLETIKQILNMLLEKVNTTKQGYMRLALGKKKH